MPVPKPEADGQIDTVTDWVELVVSDITAEADTLKLAESLLNAVADRETRALFVGVESAELVGLRVTKPLCVDDLVPDLDPEPLLLPEFVTDRLMVTLGDLEALTDPDVDFEPNGDLEPLQDTLYVRSGLTLMLEEAELDLVVDALAETEFEVDTEPELVLDAAGDHDPIMLPLALLDGTAVALDTDTDIKPEGVCVGVIDSVPVFVFTINVMVAVGVKAALKVCVPETVLVYTGLRLCEPDVVEVLDTVCDCDPVPVPKKGVYVIFGLLEPNGDADVVLDELNEPVPELDAVVVLVVLIEAVPVGQWVAVFDPEEDPVLVGEKVIMLLHDAEPVCIGVLESDTVLLIDTVLFEVAFSALLFVLQAVEVLLEVVDSEYVPVLVLLCVR